MNGGFETADIGFSNKAQHTRLEHESFILGFFYFFVLQDPLLSKYLTHAHSSSLEDLALWQAQYRPAWVFQMVSLDVFESTTQCLGQYSNGLSYLIHK